MNRYFGIAGLSSTFALWSFANVFTSIALLGAVGVFYQSLFLFVAFLIASKLKGLAPNFKESKSALPHASFRMLGLCLLTASLMYVKVGIVDTIIACNVLFVIFILAPIAGEKVKPIMILPLLTTIFGVGLVCLTGPSKNGGSTITLDAKLLFPLGAMIALAISLFLWRKCSKDIAPTKYITYMHGWVTILSIPFITFLSVANISASEFSPSLSQIGFISIALIAGTLGDMIFSLAQKFSSYIQNALIAPSGAVFSSIFGWYFADQSLALSQITGMIIVVTSVAVASALNAKSNEIIGAKIEELEESSTSNALSPAMT